MSATVELSPQSTYPHITKPEDAPAFLTKHPRWRVAAIIAEHLAWGWSAEEIQRHHPYANLAEIYSAMAYYYDHPDEIEAEIAADAHESSEFASRPDQTALRARWQAKLAAKAARSTG